MASSALVLCRRYAELVIVFGQATCCFAAGDLLQILQFHRLGFLRRLLIFLLHTFLIFIGAIGRPIPHVNKAWSDSAMRHGYLNTPPQNSPKSPGSFRPLFSDSSPEGSSLTHPVLVRAFFPRADLSRKFHDIRAAPHFHRDLLSRLKRVQNFHEIFECPDGFAVDRF